LHVFVHRQPAVATEALEVARQIKNPTVRAPLLTKLALHLPEAAMEALTTVLRVADPEELITMR